MKVSVIMPAYNEEEHIQSSILHACEALEALAVKYELLVVDDGSTDRTREKALQVAGNPHVKIVSLPRNMGKGFALKSGFENSSGELVTFVDSDADIAPRQIVTYLDAVELGDVLIGSKWHPRSATKIPFVRKILSRLFQLYVRLLTGVKCSDTQSGLKAFRRPVLEEILPLLVIKRYGFDVELLAAAQERGFRIVELPIAIDMRGAVPLMPLLGMVRTMFVEVLKIAYRMRILKLYKSRPR